MKRIGPARLTVAAVEPIRTPAETAASPPAMAVVATEAISQGASPAAITPSRRDPADTSREAAHDKSGSTTMPMATDARRRLHVSRNRRSEAGSRFNAVAKTRMASKTSMPWW
jgi:hypothetical protein